MILSIILNWLLIGYFICVKRNWYNDSDAITNIDQKLYIFANFMLSPMALIIAFCKVFIINKWK